MNSGESRRDWKWTVSFGS